MSSNVVILTSRAGTYTTQFDRLSDLVKLAGEYLDNVDEWSKGTEVIIVHRNGTLLRHNCRSGGDLMDFVRGYVACLWLLNEEVKAPMMCWTDWADKGSAHDVLTTWKDTPNEHGEIPE